MKCGEKLNLFIFGAIYLQLTRKQASAPNLKESSQSKCSAANEVNKSAGISLINWFSVELAGPAYGRTCMLIECKW